jgi:hypothetical protein
MDRWREDIVEIRLESLQTVDAQIATNSRSDYQEAFHSRRNWQIPDLRQSQCRGYESA